MGKTIRVDFKLMVWKSVELPEEVFNKYFPLLKSGEVDDLDGLINVMDYQDFRDSRIEFIADTEEPLSVHDNNLNPTIEVVDEESGDDIIWDNLKIEK